MIMIRRWTPLTWAAFAAAPAPMLALVPGTTALARAAGSISIGSTCLDGRGTVQLATCDGSATQVWSWQQDGRVRAAGVCLDISGGSTANGAPVDRDACVSVASGQKLSHLPDGTIYAAAPSASPTRVSGLW
ncbi:ricin-type beta-trefoil lectin domain protein [Streptomyces sp. NPDC058231]|uniref:ricin-type beta-trefoil lectin domain protein n=1 Tax=Streptomyces sp. NPDC058231 TaxID=3346392 RepID=UPI0036EAF44F